MIWKYHFIRSSPSHRSFNFSQIGKKATISVNYVTPKFHHAAYEFYFVNLNKVGEKRVFTPLHIMLCLPSVGVLSYFISK